MPLSCQAVKQSLYLHEDDVKLLSEMSKRMDRSMSWVVRRALAVAKKDLETLALAMEAAKENGIDAS